MLVSVGRLKNTLHVWCVVGLAAGVACEPGTLENIVRVGTDVDAESLDPRLQRNTTGFRVVNLVYDGLLQLDTTFQPIPGLAERWEHPDSVTWIFHLRDARFHDGTPVSATDVVYTFETILDPALRAPQRTLYTPIQAIDVVDERTVRFTLSEPYAPFLSYLDMGIVPRHLAESGQELGSSPIGSGPYRMLRWDKGSKIVLEANPDFWGGAPALEQIEIVVVADNTARAQAFEAGDLDLIQSPLAPPDIHRLEGDPRFVSWIRSGIAITYLNFNARHPHLQDARVRRALSMLIDQQTIVTQIYEGVDDAAMSVFPRTSWAFSDEPRQPTYDPPRARQLLGELGWRDSDGDGVLDRAGEDLSVRLATHSEDVNRVQTVEFIQNTFAENGVAAQVEVSDWPSFTARRDAGDYDIILLGWTQILDPDRITFEQFHSTGASNWGGYRNDALDSLLSRGRLLQGREERAAIYVTAAAILTREVPYYVISYQGFHAFFHPRLADFVPNPRGLLRSLATAR